MYYADLCCDYQRPSFFSILFLMNSVLSNANYNFSLTITKLLLVERRLELILVSTVKCTGKIQNGTPY